MVPTRIFRRPIEDTSSENSPASEYLHYSIPPTGTDLTVPHYPGAVLDIDSSTSSIVTEPEAVISYFTSDSPDSVKAFYGIPANEHFRKISPDSRLHRVSVAAYSTRNPQKRTKISVELSYKGPIAHLTGPGPAVTGPPPGWKPRQWKDGCVHEPVAPIVINPH